MLPNGCLLVSDDGNGGLFAVDTTNTANIVVDPAGNLLIRWVRATRCPGSRLRRQPTIVSETVSSLRMTKRRIGETHDPLGLSGGMLTVSINAAASIVTAGLVGCPRSPATCTLANCDERNDECVLATSAVSCGSLFALR